MTIEEELGELCSLFKREVEHGTFAFTPFEKSARFLNHLKKALLAKEIEPSDAFNSIVQLRNTLIEFEQAIQQADRGDPDKQSPEAKHYKQMIFKFIGHQAQEIKALLEQEKKPPSVSSSGSNPSPSKHRAAFRKKGWLRT